MELAKFVITIVAGLFFVGGATRGWGRTERRIALASVAAHCFGGIAQEFVYSVLYTRGGDMTLYQFYGEAIGRYLSNDFARNAPDVVDLLFQNGRSPLPFFVMRAGSSTGSMSALAGFISYAWSNELYVIGAGIGVMSTLGSVLFFKSLRGEIRAEHRVTCAAVVFLLPSVVFWSSALLKESVIMFGIGLTTYGIQRSFVLRRYVLGWLSIIIGGSIIAIYKSYVLAGFFCAVPPLILAIRASRRGQAPRVSPSRIFTLAVLGFLFLYAFGQVFEQYAVTDLGGELANEQSATLISRGGSTYKLVSSGSSSLVGQLAYAPAAIITVLFRPFLFEATNTQSAVNALESTALLLLVVASIRRVGVRDMLKHLLKHPMLLFVATYALALGLGIGLATTNLGTLSRYRIPMYAHFAVLATIFFLEHRARRPLQVEETRYDRRQ